MPQFGTADERNANLYIPKSKIKFRRKRSVFDGAPIGVKRLEKIVFEFLEKKTFRKDNAKATSNVAVLIHNVFKKYDVDNSGKIDKDEFTQLCLDIGVRNVAQKDVDDLFDKYDNDGSGELTYRELTNGIKIGYEEVPNSIIDLPSTVNAFSQLYKKKDEKIHRFKQEFWAQMRYCGLTTEEVFDWVADTEGRAKHGRITAVFRSRLSVGIGQQAVLDDLFKMADEDNKGWISYEEFRDMLVRNERQKRKYKRKESILNHRPVGVQALDKIFREKLEIKMYSSQSVNAVASGRLLARLFRTYDKDDTGSIDCHEFTALIKGLGIRKINQTDVNGLFKMYDNDNSGCLDYKEFIDTIMSVHNNDGADTSVIDLPCTRDAFFTRFMSREDQKYNVRLSFARGLKDALTPAQALLDSVIDEHTGLLPRRALQNRLRQKLHVGLGVEGAFTEMLTASEDPKNPGFIKPDTFLEVFGCNERYVPPIRESNKSGETPQSKPMSLEDRSKMVRQMRHQLLSSLTEDFKKESQAQKTRPKSAAAAAAAGGGFYGRPNRAPDAQFVIRGSGSGKAAIPSSSSSGSSSSGRGRGSGSGQGLVSGRGTGSVSASASASARRPQTPGGASRFYSSTARGASPRRSWGDKNAKVKVKPPSRPSWNAGAGNRLGPRSKQQQFYGRAAAMAHRNPSNQIQAVVYKPARQSRPIYRPATARNAQPRGWV